MSRKIRVTGAILTFVVFLVGLVFVCSLSSKNVGVVKSLKAENVTASSVSLKWNKVGSADGYFVYVKPENTDKYTKIATIKDGKTTNISAKKLLSSCDYSVYVNAYKMHKNTVIESKKFEPISLKTNPEKMVLTASSEEKATLDISWKPQERINGYELQYSLGKDLEKGKILDINDVKKATTRFKKLKVGKDYYVQARAYYLVGEEKVYGEWSDIVKATILEGVDLSHIDPNKPMVALTYDDGPGYNSASDKILDVIEKYGIHATFFMVGQNAADHPKNVKRKVSLGCQIGNHTYNHNHYGKNVTASDIKKASDAIYKAGGVYPTCFRSPGGMTTEAIRSECKKENMALYYWSLDTQDWKSRNADAVYNAVMNNVRDGDIILMHEIYDSTAEATARMVPALIKKGYQLVTCEELVAAKTGKPSVAGTQYVNATTIKNKTS